MASKPFRGERSIKRLPQDVVDQLKSSIAIVSLSGVILELLRNALDAAAANIEVTVDFSRGDCVVEDDGIGIAPHEFSAGGALGKPHCTSKYVSNEACYGRHGMFLASLAAVSLLTVTSRHHEHRSLNSITFHNSRTIERRIPAPPHDDLKYEAHGTRVTVRNLFGNLPVRVKRRSLLADQKGEKDRLSDLLKRDVVGLLLGWQRPISLVVRDSARRTIVKLNSRAPSPHSETAPMDLKVRSLELQYILNMFTQAAWITVSDWSSWVPASACTSSISIKGAISLEPAPTKRLQFLTFGISPIPNDNGHNALYEEINRMFGLSSFGTVEQDADLDENEKLRRHNDNRYKTGGYTIRQLIGRKGVDRYPMFHLCIRLKDHAAGRPYGQHFLDKEANVQAVMEVLQALITQWLSIHHFRPRKQQPRVPKDSPGRTTSGLNVASPDGTGRFSRPLSAQPASLKRELARPELHPPSSSAKRQLSLNDWSRVKSGKADFFDRLRGPFKRPESAPEQLQVSHEYASTLLTAGHARSNVDPVLPDTLNNAFGERQPHEDGSAVGDGEVLSELDDDQTITWTDPRTKTAISLNARTGCLVSRHGAPMRHDRHDLNASSGHAAQSSQQLRLRERARPVAEQGNTWLAGLLQSWNNPIFSPCEQPIQQICVEEPNRKADGYHQSRHFHSTHVARTRLLNGSMVSSGCKLSREGLQGAEVIAQLDKKFVLVKMAISSQGLSYELPNVNVLVLIDQHAADERIKVEALFAELCAVEPETRNQYCSNLGHRSRVAVTILEKPMHFTITVQECQLFITHAISFAAWGILFDISEIDSATILDPDRERRTISVTALPPAISERCRSDPKSLIAFLRAAVWKYAEQLYNRGSEDLFSKPASEVAEPPPWVRHLASSPHGLVDLVNSRACRSAIMFNDELSKEQCQELVLSLSKCVFPFACAHGRPSMVPLVALDSQDNVSEKSITHTHPSPQDSGTGFVSAWKSWRAASTH
ncbi:uncharacterized protein EI97DRAFT_461289 [Westerdykella ornata]|uniref:MutL C-terminal dimerisation domain-containing protein n=1 Tax=Westerdykella ornata TaxID=318751 RepID=A0A6A6JC55_WESOR|nr:uncharacterized protein EI97DRAFT_461289 [Westerdykella ornata]KAF2273216.1 hypothetical protein EI97DRAFT_461289 [Westerdykella ornata]